MNNTNNDDIFDFTGIIINLYYTLNTVIHLYYTNFYNNNNRCV